MPSRLFNYPVAPRSEVVDNLFHKDVPDPYRVFEDPRCDKTREFVAEQNKVTESYLAECPHKQRIREILERGQNYKKIGCPFKRGEKYYFSMNEGLQPQSVLYQQDTIHGEPKVFFDPNTLSSDGTVALSHASFSKDGEYFAYGLQHSGSDWVEIGIKRVSTGEDLEEKLKRAKFTSIAWTHDNKGFFYAQYPAHEGDTEGTEVESNQNHAVFYHSLGTPQSEDVLKVDFPGHPNWIIGFEVSHDGRSLHVFPCEGCNENGWFYCDINEHSLTDKFILLPLYDKMGGKIQYISNIDKSIYIRTNLDSKNYKVVRVDEDHTDKKDWIHVIGDHAEDVLEMAEIYTVKHKHYLLVSYLRDVVYYLELHELGGGLVHKFNTSLSTISKLSGRPWDNEFFFHCTSFLTPGEIYHVDLTKSEIQAELLKRTQCGDFDPDLYKIEQVFYPSTGGVAVPMFIVSRKDFVRNGNSPCVLYGYGGFNINITSAFNINRIAWLKNFKGVLAVANIRGGGEFGEAWHISGKLLNKKNCFDDFIAAGEYLVKNKYTCTDRLAIQGGSNGGLLVAAVSNQRPDLFGAMICHVGVLDMIRYPLFTIGHIWRTEFGDPENEEHFHYLLSYSPYHNIPDNSGVNRFPATLLLTADHDDRVVPAHSLKYIAQLQYKLGKKLPETPLLIHVDTKAGHGGGRPISKVIDEYADIYSFLYNVFDLVDYYSDN